MEPKKVFCRNIQGEKIETLVSDLSFRPSIYAVLVQDGKVLVLPQWDGYDFPGGGVHLGEPLMDALKREVKEESGYDVEPKELFGLTDDFFQHPDGKRSTHSICIYYLCDIVGGELSDEYFTEGEKTWAKKAEWMDIAAAVLLNFKNPYEAVVMKKLLERFG